MSKPYSHPGRVLIVIFLALVVISQPPVIHRFVARVDGGAGPIPFLYLYLFGVYVVQIAVLILAARKELR